MGKERFNTNSEVGLGSSLFYTKGKNMDDIILILWLLFVIGVFGTIGCLLEYLFEGK